MTSPQPSTPWFSKSSKPWNSGREKEKQCETFPVFYSLCWWHPRSTPPASFLHFNKEMKGREYRQKILQKMPVGLPKKMDNERCMGCGRWLQTRDFCFVLLNWRWLTSLSKSTQNMTGQELARQIVSSRRMPLLSQQDKIRLFKALGCPSHRLAISVEGMDVWSLE